jgi:hypothetical protein
MIALSGVRSSWLMFARNSLLCRLAAASSADLAWISLNNRTFSMAIAAWSANVSTSWISLELKGRTSFRAMPMMPTSLPSPRCIGRPSIVR